MSKRLTKTVDADINDALHRVICHRRISRFLNDLARPHVVGQELCAEYRAMNQIKNGLTDTEAWLRVRADASGP